MTAQLKDGIPDTGVYFWVDVRDVALAHVQAMEVPEAAGKRFFVLAGYFSNRELVDILRKSLPDYKDKLPAEDAKGGEFPSSGIYKFDNSRSRDILKIEYRSFEECIVDTAKSLQSVGA